MSIQANKALVRRFVEVIQNEHNLDALDDFFSADFVDFGGMFQPPNRAGLRPFFEQMRAAFPDHYFTIRQQIAEDRYVVSHKTFHGTHLGPFMGIPASGKQVSFDLIDIVTVENGKISEHRVISDQLGLMQQLGVIPAPA